jgi:hypothetical protein
MKSRFQILTSVAFLSGLALLLLNDFFFKQMFGNFFTGKLSDFAGMFVFPLFLMLLFPRHKTKVFLFSALFFIFWKSPFSQPMINLWNSFGLFRAGRVVDYTDLFALTMLPLAWMAHSRRHKLKLVKIHPALPLLMALFALTATSYTRNFEFDQTWEFTYSKHELVAKINTLSQSNNSRNLPLSLNISNANEQFRAYDETQYFYVSDYFHYIDTIYKQKSKTEIDTIYHHAIPVRDTMYIPASGTIIYRVPVKQYMPESKTGYCDFVDAKIIILGDDTKSSVTLKMIYTGNCMGMFEKEAERNEKKNLLKAFEHEFVTKLFLLW